MVDGIDAVGEAVTGGMAARAVEPEAGEGAGHGESCLNCGAALIGDYCHQCGQRGHVHRTLTAWWHDLAHGVLHLDGKIWRTLPLLAWKPGELTRRYVHGERARFVSPMALFLFSVFLMFAIFSALGGPVVTKSNSGGDSTPAQERAEARQDYEKDRAKDVAKLDRLRQKRARLVAAGESTADVDPDIAEAEREIALEDQLYKKAIALIDAAETRETARSEAKETPATATPAKDSDDENIVVVSGADSINGWFNESYKKAKENPSLLIYKLQTNAYKFSWALIPISAPLVWLLFLHRRRYRQYKLYDHMVFVTYSIAFMSLGVIALTLLRPLGLSAAVAVLAMIFIPPVHMYRQLRGAYLLSRWSALWRTIMLLIFASIAAALFGLLLLALGVLH